MALADDGSFLDSAKAQSFGTFSFDRFGELAGPVSDAGGRVDALLRKAERGPVDELLLRAVRWVGRAAAATTPEDAFLYSMIALDCVVRPTP